MKDDLNEITKRLAERAEQAEARVKELEAELAAWMKQLQELAYVLDRTLGYEGKTLAEELDIQTEKAFTVGQMVMRARASKLVGGEAAQAIAALEPFRLKDREKWIDLHD